MSSEGSCGPAAGRAAPPLVLEEASLPSGDPFPGGSDPQTCGGWLPNCSIAGLCKSEQCVPERMNTWFVAGAMLRYLSRGRRPGRLCLTQMSESV